MIDENHARPGEVAPSLANAASSIQTLVDWFKENRGYLSPDVEIAYDKSSGFHVRATRPLTSPMVVRCPLKLTISHLNLDHSQTIVPHINSPLQQCLGEIPDRVLTYLLLIEQRCLADEGKSAWQPYFECLPKPDEMTTTLWFDKKDMEYLQGTDLHQATLMKKRELTDEYEDAVSALMRLGIKPEQNKITWKLYLWAVTIMSSRSFVSTYMLPTVKTFPILFPVIDILNHTTNAKVNWTFEEGFFTIATAEQDTIRAGDQIYNNYAPKQNSELLLGYGFAVKDNPVEQFAIKMRLPADMMEAAKDLRFYESENVSFGMPKSLLEGNPGEEQHFLRPRGHVFGHYENAIPWLRRIPAWIVHSAFVATCMQLGHTPEDIDIRDPAGIIVLQVLLQLYEAVRVKSLLLQTATQTQTTEPQNVMQTYAKIYRDGQAKIIHGIRRELGAVISKLRVSSKMPPPSPAIITTTEALITAREELSPAVEQFEMILRQIYNADTTTTTTYATQITGHEKEIWIILIFLFAYLTILTPNPQGLIHDWILEWLEIHTLPSVASLPTNPHFDASILSDYILVKVSELNHIQANFLDQAGLDARFGDLPIWDDDDDAGLDRLGDKLMIWAMEVVELYSFTLYEDEDREGTATSVGMYMRPYREVGLEEKWVYEDVEVPDAKV